MNIPTTLLEAMKLLEAKGLKITQISVTEELAKRMIDCREALDQIDYKNLPLDFRFSDLDSEFDVFLPVELAHPEYVKTKPDNLIGFMFGIGIYIDKSSTMEVNDEV